jgi:hypothetical protein
MPSDDDETRDSLLSPTDDERIRRLLAEARHTDPSPDDVAARLDDVLRDLAHDREERAAAQPAAGAKVVELAARRRRTAVNLLVAAAAVVVLGVGISQVLPQGGGMDAATTAEDAGGGSDGALLDDGDAAGPESEPEPPQGADQLTYQVRSKHFGADVRKLRLEVQDLASQPATAESRAYALECVANDVGAGDKVPVSYDGAQGLVVLRLPSGDVQVVDLYLCGDTEPRRSITLTTP